MDEELETVQDRGSYVAGVLIRMRTPRDRCGDADEEDDCATVPESAGLSEESNDERKAVRTENERRHPRFRGQCSQSPS